MSISDESTNTARFDLQELAPVRTLKEIAALPPDTVGVFVNGLTDDKLAAIAARVPRLRYLITDGNTGVTDAGLRVLGTLDRLESLDLEWSAVTDAGLATIATLRALRWVGLGFCEGISAHGLTELRRVRPDLEAVGTAI